ncbi:hypothetical protein BH10ACI1_BH10ACI1_24990 [soil metagenome]
MKKKEIQSNLENAYSLIQQHNYEEALSILDSLIDNLKQSKYDEYYTSALLFTGICCYEMGQIDKSWFSLKEGLASARKKGDPNTIGEFLHEIDLKP